MNWITLIWAMIAAVCLAQAAVHFLIWGQHRPAWHNLFFALTATATAGLAACELWMMHAQTTAQFGAALRWVHVPAWAVIGSLVAFVWSYLKAGRLWLGWTIIALRTVSLLLNFLSGQNLNFRVVTGLRQIPFMGELVSVGEGIANPWMLVGQLSMVLLVFFIVDAAITVWRRGDRRQALFVSGNIALFSAMGTIQSILVLWGIVQWPITVSMFFMLVVVAMSYEISRDLLHAAQIGRELRESEQRMELAAEATGLGFWLRDFSKSGIWVSEKWRTMFGFAQEDQLDLERVAQRVHPDDREMFRQTLAKAINEVGHYEFEFRALRFDGQVRWISTRGRIAYDDAGRPAFLRAVSLDITERKEVEQEVQQQRTELALFSRATMLGELSGSLAHELNQPLSSILRNAEAAELFLQHPVPDLEELRAIMVDIRNDNLRAGAVINRMRNFLQRHEVERRPVDLNELVAEVIRMVRTDATMRKVELAFAPGATLPLVRGDRVQLQQVVLNILLNAMDAMRDSAPNCRRVSVGVELAGRSIVVAVSDTGHGIAAEKLANIFAPFFTTKEKGLGMGLAISRTIVEAHGGRIWAENRPNGGTTFSFTVPVAVS